MNVRISVHATKDLVNSAEIFTVDSLTSIVAGTGNLAWDGKSLAELMRTGVINPGQLEGVREILNSSDGKVSVDGSTNNFATTGDVDFAVFNDIIDNYTIEGDNLATGVIEVSDQDGDGFISVAHIAPVGGGGGGNRIEDGTDKIRNFEILQFADGIVNLAGIANSVATGTPRIIGTPAVGNVLTVVTTDDPSTPLPINEAIADADGLPPLSQITFTWQVETGPLTGIFVTLTDPVTGEISPAPPSRRRRHSRWMA